MIRIVLAFCISHTFTLGHLTYLSPFAMWTAFPPSDYYGDSVPVRLAPFRESRFPAWLTLSGWFRCPTHTLEVISRDPFPRSALSGNAPLPGFSRCLWNRHRFLGTTGFHNP